MRERERERAILSERMSELVYLRDFSARLRKEKHK